MTNYSIYIYRGFNTRHCVSLSGSSPYKPGRGTEKLRVFQPASTTKLGIFLVTTQYYTQMFLPKITQYVQNDVPLLADEVHISLTHFRILINNSGEKVATTYRIFSFSSAVSALLT